jgi:hypothetical protein
MAWPRDHRRFSFSGEEAVARHLCFAHHVGHIPEIKPKPAVGCRSANDQQAVESQLSHHLANVFVAALVFCLGKARVRKALVHALQFFFR